MSKIQKFMTNCDLREKGKKHSGNREHCSLAKLDIGQSARISEIRCEGEKRRRLFDLGLIPGTMIRADIISPLGNPVAYRFRGTLIALRKGDASKIIISKINSMGVD